MSRFFLSTILLISSVLMLRADINSAKALYNDGRYTEAIAELKPLVQKAPKDAAANYYLGASYYKLGDFNAAMAPLKVALGAKWTAAAQDLAEISLKTYNLDAATDYVDMWQEILDKAKQEYPLPLQVMRDRILMARNMLDRVENIEIVDTILVDSLTFFSYYNLSADAGELVDSSILPDEYAALSPKVVYIPQNGKEMFWGMESEYGITQIVVADVLDDGTVTEPVPLGHEVNGVYDADYPFLLEDGVTLYFGSNSEESLGGYDIFMTRRSPDGSLLQPQNVGMPYNSPYNDYMMAIDENRNLGWWASDRQHIPGKVTIYVFVPSKMRVNYDPESPELVKYALLDGITTTGDLDSRIANTPDVEDSGDNEFYFTLSDGRVYTSIEQFRNPQARQAMKNLLKRQMDFEILEAQLSQLRISYAKGDKSVANDILKLERSVKDAPAAIERLTNQIISLETR